MLRALLASGALLQGVKASISAQVSRIATLAGGAFVFLIFLNIGLAALAFSAAIALTQIVGGALAAAIVGIGSILIGALIMWIASRAGRAPAASSPAPSQSSGFPALPGGLGGGSGAPPLPWMLAAAAIGLVLARGSGRRDDDRD